MLASDAQRIVVKMLLSISSNEEECINAKNNLLNHNDYSSLQCFKRLDTKNKRTIDQYSIVDFLKLNSIYCSFIEAEYLIMLYDKEDKGRYDLNDFYRLLGCSNAGDKHSNELNRDYLPLPYEIEHLLSKVFEAEINLIRDFLCYLRTIKKQFDFSAYDMLDIMHCKEYISKENLKCFLLKETVYLKDIEIDMIFNKLDLQKRGQITFDILQRIFLEQYNHNNNHHHHENDCKVIDKTGLITTDTNNTEQSTRISDTLTIKKGMPFPKGKESIIINKPTSSVNIDFQYQRDLISFFNLLMEIESEIEQLKIIMTFQADFNICDFFTFLDQGRKGYLTERDLLTGFNRILGNIIEKQDISLLMKKYDLNRQGVLDYQDCFDMLTPFSKDNRDIIERRYSHHVTPLSFSYLTKYSLTLLLKYLISSEKQIEKERQCLSNIPPLALSYVFSHIDRQKNGFFTPNELESFLQLSNVIFLKKECDLFFIRLDRNRDGKASLDDIHFELMLLEDHSKK